MKTNPRKQASTGTVALLIVLSYLALCIVPAMAGAHPQTPSRQAKGMKGGKPHRMPLGIWRNPQLIQELGLSDNQVNQLREVDFATREKQLELKAQLDGSRLQMDKAFSQKSVDDKAVRQLAEKIAGIKGRLFVKTVESRLAVFKILNAVQINKLKLRKMGQREKNIHQGNRSMSGFSSLEQFQDHSLSAAISD